MYAENNSVFIPSPSATGGVYQVLPTIAWQYYFFTDHMAFSSFKRLEWSVMKPYLYVVNNLIPSAAIYENIINFINELDTTPCAENLCMMSLAVCMHCVVVNHQLCPSTTARGSRRQLKEREYKENGTIKCNHLYLYGFILPLCWHFNHLGHDLNYKWSESVPLYLYSPSFHIIIVIIVLMSVEMNNMKSLASSDISFKCGNKMFNKVSVVFISLI